MGQQDFDSIDLGDGGLGDGFKDVDGFTFESSNQMSNTYSVDPSKIASWAIYEGACKAVVADYDGVVTIIKPTFSNGKIVFNIPQGFRPLSEFDLSSTNDGNSTVPLARILNERNLSQPEITSRFGYFPNSREIVFLELPDIDQKKADIKVLTIQRDDGLQEVVIEASTQVLEQLNRLSPIIDSILLNQGYEISSASIKPNGSALSFMHDDMWIEGSYSLANLIEVFGHEYHNLELIKFLEDNPEGANALVFYYSSSRNPVNVIKLNPFNLDF